MTAKRSSSPQKPLVSILTPSIPERAHFLEECKASVEAQTFDRYEHLVDVDVQRTGCANTVNRLAERAQGDWLFILADDDILLPRCLEHHLAFADNADIVYAHPLVWGESHDQFRMGPPGIPATALIRMELWRKLGGYDPKMTQIEDRVLWVSAEAKQARFVLAEGAPTWVYRFHRGNKSRNMGKAS